MSIDQRGFKTLIQQEGTSFLTAQQQMLDATVRTVAHSKDGVTITLTDGTTISADYAVCTFSVGVLQNDDVQFSPRLSRRYHSLPLFIPYITETILSIQERSYPGDGDGYIY